MDTMLNISSLLMFFIFGTNIYAESRHIHINRDVGYDCKTIEGHDGACTVLLECKPLIDKIRNDTTYHEKLIHCNFIGSSSVVCCPGVTPTVILNTGIISSNNSGNDTNILFEDNDTDYNWLTTTPKTLPIATTTNVPIMIRNGVGAKAEFACNMWRGPYFTHHIIGGEVADVGEFPHMAGLGYRFPNSKYSFEFRCGGSLISPDFVLTAAHCVYNDSIQPTFVRLGKTTINSTVDNADEVDVDILEIIIHDQYKSYQKYHDIALLRLRKSVNVNNSNAVRPACLSLDQNDVGPDVQLYASGWGKINNFETSDVLLKTNLTILPLETCKEKFNNISKIPYKELPNGIVESQLCADDKGEGRDTCQGDSGGPLQILDDPLITIIYGIVSFGAECNSTYPGVYVRVAHYIDWIENIVWP